MITKEFTPMTMVCGFAFTEEDSLVLVNKTALWWEGTRKNGVGGKIKQGEGIRSAMSREFNEETGVLVDVAHWYQFHTETYRNGNKVHYLVAGLSNGTDKHGIKATEKSPKTQEPSCPVVVLPSIAWFGADFYSEAPGLTYLIPMAWDFYSRDLDMRWL